MFKIWKYDSISEYDGSKLNLLNFFILCLKTVYSTWITRFVIILSPLLITLALSVMMPLHYYLGAGQVFVTTLSAGTIWGMTYFSFRKSTIYENIRGIKNSNILMYTSILLTMIFVTFSSELIFWISSIAFYYIIPSSIFELFLKSFNSEYEYVWGKVDWLTLIYTWIMQVLLVFVVAFSFRTIFTKEKNWFITLFIFVMILFPFGGLFRPNLEYAINNGIIINNFNLTKWISLLFPQTCLNYMSFAAISSGTIIDGVSIGNIEIFNSWIISSDYRWNIVIFYPIFILIIFSLISILTINFIK